jgi:predicted  nucleic acid-binding Zn-ribbon protein
MRSVVLLAQLNEIDLTVDAHKARLAEIAEAAREPAALIEARRGLARAESDLTHCRAVQTELEAAQKAVVEKLSRAETRLYSGGVRNPKELEDLQLDAAQLRRQLSQAEDNLLEALICAETATQAQAEQAALLERLTAEQGRKHAALRAEHAQIKAKLAAELVQQAAARQAVPAPLLTTYDNLRPRRGGRAVAKLDGEECSACLVAASPFSLEAARFGDELVYCSNCGRLLWGE